MSSLPPNHSFDFNKWDKIFNDDKTSPVKYYLGKNSLETNDEATYLINEFLMDAASLGVLNFSDDTISKGEFISYESINVIGYLEFILDINHATENLPIIIGGKLYTPDKKRHAPKQNVSIVQTMLDYYNHNHLEFKMRFDNKEATCFFKISNTMSALLRENAGQFSLAYNKLRKN